MAGVSGVSLVNTIQSEIERARQDLKGVDENLRRLTGRDFNDPKKAMMMLIVPLVCWRRWLGLVCARRPSSPRVCPELPCAPSQAQYLDY
ncbi:Pinin [Portunus trituberculatus]|uniref:Pinin n=1 Tax=Portunus trituberculatus TaxID=210409 RepID=A0A5B7FAN1_PORTR|nr:Pinin [Portunus trituberculatus]